jgi:ETFB lysine methyltransferase
VTRVVERAIPGGWSDRVVAIGPHMFRLHTPADPDEVLGQIELPEAASQPEFADPYWAKLWPAAPLLAAAIVRNPPPRGMRVLELGCGSGLVGIAALACGMSVTFSDYVPLAVELAVHNAARNGFLHVKGMVLDWRQPQEERFNFIVAADVTYDRMNLPPLLNVVERMLVVGGEAWFGDAGRSPAEDFCEQARGRGWNVMLFDEDARAVDVLRLGEYRRIVIGKYQSNGPRCNDRITMRSPA